VFFTVSAKKQILTLTTESAMYSRRNRGSAPLPIRGSDRHQDADYLQGTPALWACKLVRHFSFFDQIVARNVTDQQLELLQNLSLPAAHPTIVAHLPA